MHEVTNAVCSAASPSMGQHNPCQRAVGATFLAYSFQTLSSAHTAPLKRLHDAMFPIEYPQMFYDSVTGPNQDFVCKGAFDQAGELVAFLIGRIHPFHQCDEEDRDMLFDPAHECVVGYILTLGVAKEHRGNGIATWLVSDFTTLCQQQECDAIYLHVLTTNEGALQLYNRYERKVAIVSSHKYTHTQPHVANYDA
eukprot:m.237804 g.237804  ORF g.237804 m.237804 type:complete len:196 (+) comp15279_c0_seq2:436-1023(+)